jgi:hypothetical protein
MQHPALATIDIHQLHTVSGGASTEATAIKRVAAENAANLKKYNRKPETAGGQAVIDTLNSIPLVKGSGEAIHRTLRGVSEGTVFKNVGSAAY